MQIPLMAAFSGWRGIPWVCWSTNAFTPALAFHPDHIECRVIRTRRKPYETVALVDYRRAIATRNVVIEFADSRISFTGNAVSEDAARKAVGILAGRGCRLTARAEALMNS